MTAINFPNSPSNGDTLSVGSTTYTYNSTKGYWDATPTGSSIDLTSVGSHILPSADVTYDLGSSSKKWRDLYLSGSSIKLGGQDIVATASGIQLPELTIGSGNTTVKLGVDSSGNIEQTATVGGTPQTATQSVALTDLSVTSASASGGGTLAYTSATGVFTYTPPDLTVKADVASPTFTGTPAAPTASASTNTTQIATTAFVQTELAGLVDSAPGALNTLNELAAAINDDASFSTTITNSLAAKAPLASPALTGTPTAPTATTSDDSTKIATTAFVVAKVGASGGATTLNGLTDVNTSGVSSGQVLSYTGSAWGVADAGSGGSGGSIDLTANGAITAGRAVVIDTDGKVSQVANTTTTLNVETPHFDESGYINIELMYNQTNNKFLAIGVYQAGNDDLLLMYDGTTGANVLNSTQNSALGYYTTGSVEVLSGSDAGKHILSYRSSSDFLASVVTITGNSASVTAPTTLLTSHSGAGRGNHPAIWDKANENAIILTADNSSQLELGAIAVSISGTTLTAGSDTNAHTDANMNYRERGINGSQRSQLAYSEHAGLGIMTYAKTGTYPWNQSDSGIYYRTVTSDSSRNITLGSETQILSGTIGFLTTLGGSSAVGSHQFAITPDGTKFILAVENQSGINNQTVQIPHLVYTGTISTSGVLQNLSSATTISGDTKKARARTVPGQNSAFFFSYITSNTTSGHQYNTDGHIPTSTSTLAQSYVTVAANGTHTISSPTTVSIGAARQVQAAVSGSKWFILGHALTPSHRSLYYGNFNFNFGSNFAEWVGIAGSTVSDGQTLTVTLPGGTNDQQSGMTIEGEYFVQEDGTITTSSTAEKAGVALSATKLLVADNTANATAGPAGATGPAGPAGATGPALSLIHI